MQFPHILLTPLSVEYWGQILLGALLLAFILSWQVHVGDLARRRTHYLALALALYLLHIMLFAFRSSALTVERMIWNILVNPVIALNALALTKFVYHMPALPGAWRREERIVTFVTVSFLIGEVVFCGFRLWGLWHGQVFLRIWWMDLVLSLWALWLLLTLIRQVRRARQLGASTIDENASTQPPDVRTAQGLLLVPMSFVTLAAIANGLQIPLRLSPDMMFYLISLLSMAMLVAVMLIYLNYYAPRSSFVVQTTGIMVMLTILVIATAGRAVTNVMTDNYPAPDVQVGTIRFTPDGEAYAIETFPTPDAPNAQATSTAPRTLTPQAETAGMAPVALPFAFPFFGRPWATIYVHPAGFLTFGAPQQLIDLEFRYGAVPAIFALYRAGAALPDHRYSPRRMSMTATDDEVRIHWGRSAASGAIDSAEDVELLVVLRADGAFTITHAGAPRLPPSAANPGAAAQQWVGAHNGDIMYAPPLVVWSEVNGMRVPMTQTLVADAEFPPRAYLHPMMVQLAILMFVSVLTAVGAIPLFLRVGFMQPLERLLAGVEQMRRGDLAVQIPIQQHNEIGDITETFNQLAASQRLLLENLEEQVRERTHSLVTTNQQLHHAITLYQQTQRELEQLNRQLDDRVQERTRELAQSEARFRRVIASISDHVYAFTLNPLTGVQMLDFLSPNLRSFVNGETDDFWTKWRDHIVTPDDLAIYDQHVADLFVGRNSQVEYRLRQPDGQQPWMLASVRCEQLSTTEIHCYGVMSDISTRKQLEQEAAARRAAQEIESLRSEWLGNMSHELRTPLGLIKTAVTTLLADDVTIPPSMQHSILVRLNQEADRLTDLVSTLLDLSRLETARLRLTYMATDVCAMLQEVVDAAKLQMQLRSAPQFAVKLELASPCLYATIDRERMKRVVQNLLSNAMKFSPENSEITVRAAIAQAHLVIAVEDHGVGIDDNEFERIFERYYQVKQPGIHNQAGVGLGLPICREIANAHGGEISLTSRSARRYRDSGTTFVVKVPVTPPQTEET
jgi:signal transduction histidine kinase/HAMP domain-containing protein